MTWGSSLDTTQVVAGMGACGGLDIAQLVLWNEQQPCMLRCFVVSVALTCLCCFTFLLLSFCFSLGCSILRQLHLKEKLMAQLERPSPEVQSQALLACSKLMVASWQFMEGGDGGFDAKKKRGR